MITGKLALFFVAIACLQTVSRAGSIHQTTTVNSVIKYPGPHKEPLGTRYGTDDENPSDDGVPESCRGLSYCSVKSKTYPQEKFNKMFKGTKPIPQPTLVTEDVDDRLADPEEKDNCESEVKYEPLYHVRPKRSEWRDVVQAPGENFVQMVRMETCKNPDSSCFNVFPATDIYKTFCKQTNSMWELLVDSENGPEKVKVELPTCCSCHYRSVGLD